jgi:hypothetical protein
MTDAVNHPRHYAKNGGIECIEAQEASMSKEAFRGALKFNVQKYVWRYEDKEEPLKDLKKARWYLDLLIFSMETESEQEAVEALEKASQQCEGGFCPMPNQVQPVPGIRYDLPGKQVMFAPVES